MHQQPLAVIHPEAKIGANVVIGPFVFIDKNVEIGDGTELAPNVTILSGSRIGKNCKIHSGAVIGGIPQDLKFQGEDSLAIVGDNCILRECVTINRGTKSKGQTVVGNGCLIMAYCHVAHDCIVGNGVIMSNNTQLAGEVVIDDFVGTGGGTLVHQFTRIGTYSFLQGGTRIAKDIPPYTMVGREPASYAGLNVVGLRRRGFDHETIELIQNIYRTLYQSGLNISQAIEKIEAEIPQTEVRDQIVSFVRSSSRGIVGALKKE